MAARNPLITLCAGLLALAGCATAPNSPSLVLDTQKTPSQYAECVFPKWQKEKPGSTLTQSRNQATIVAEGKVAADQILEVHRATNGSQVSIYLRGPLPGGIGHTRLEKSARECL